VIRTVVDFLGYMACWWAAILGAANGLWWPGPAVAVSYLVIHLGFLDPTREAGRRVVLGTVVGIVVEQGNMMAGVTAFAGSPPVAPPWMIGLWAAFSATAGLSMAWLRGRTVLAAVLGGVAGPLTFMAGARMGALTLGPWATPVLAVEWALATAWLTKSRGQTPSA
jgi:hypothetical protein